MPRKTRGVVQRLRLEWEKIAKLTEVPPSEFADDEPDTRTDKERLSCEKSDLRSNLITRLLELQAHEVALDLIQTTPEEEGEDTREELVRDLVMQLVANEHLDTAREILRSTQLLSHHSSFDLWHIVARCSREAADRVEMSRAMDRASRAHSNHLHGYLAPIQMQVWYWELTRDPLDLQVVEIMQSQLPTQYRIPGHLSLVRAAPTVEGFLKAFNMAEGLTNRRFQAEMLTMIMRDIALAAQIGGAMPWGEPINKLTVDDLRRLIEKIRPEWRNALRRKCDSVGVTF